MRIEVFYKNPADDGRALKICRELRKWVSNEIEAVAVSDVYLTDFGGLSPQQAAEAFADRVAQRIAVDVSPDEENFFPGWSAAVEVTYKAGVSNPVAVTARKAIETVTDSRLPLETAVQTAAWRRSCTG